MSFLIDFHEFTLVWCKPTSRPFHCRIVAIMISLMGLLGLVLLLAIGKNGENTYYKDSIEGLWSISEDNATPVLYFSGYEVSLE